MGALMLALVTLVIRGTANVPGKMITLILKKQLKIELCRGQSGGMGLVVVNSNRSSEKSVGCPA